MKSIFIGIALVLLWGPLSPITAMWLIGERIQGRKPSWSVDESGDSSGAMAGLIMSAMLVTMLCAMVTVHMAVFS